jgi:hypothetical protein
MATGDEVQFNAGIAALPTAGGKLLASAGNFNLATHILFNKNYIDFSGAGYGAEHIGAGSGIEGQGGTTLVTSVASIAAIRFAEPSTGLNASGCTLHDFGIFGNSGVVATTYGIVLDNAWSLDLHRIRIVNCGSYGVYASAGNDIDQVYADKVYVLGCGSGQWSISDGGQYLLENCYGIADAGSTILFFFEDVDSVRFTNCIADHGLRGFHIQSTLQNTHGVQLLDCESYGATDTAFYVYVTAGKVLTTVYFQGCTAKDAFNGYQLGVYGSLRDCKIINSRSYANTVGVHLVGDSYIGDSIYPGLDLSHHTFQGCTTNYDAVTNWTGVIANSIISLNQGYIAPGELRTASGALTAGNANAIGFAWHNPEAQDILVLGVYPDVQTPGGTAGAVCQMGIADDAAGTNLGSEFFTGFDLNTAAIRDSALHGDTGAQVRPLLLQDSASATDGWIVGKILTQNAAALAGPCTVKYQGR